MDSLISNNTWKLVDLPPGCKPIGCKWVHRRKLKPDRTIEKFKTKLVAKGFKQKEDIDFFYTFIVSFYILLLLTFGQIIFGQLYSLHCGSLYSLSL
jgi:hypothetical protein